MSMYISSSARITNCWHSCEMMVVVDFDDVTGHNRENAVDEGNSQRQVGGCEALIGGWVFGVGAGS